MDPAFLNATRELLFSGSAPRREAMPDKPSKNLLVTASGKYHSNLVISFAEFHVLVYTLRR